MFLILYNMFIGDYIVGLEVLLIHLGLIVFIVICLVKKNRDDEED